VTFAVFFTTIPSFDKVATTGLLVGALSDKKVSNSDEVNFEF
jgi:hypothetical protein